MTVRNSDGWTIRSDEPAFEPKITVDLDHSVPADIDAIVVGVSGSVPAYVSIEGARAPKVGDVFLLGTFEDGALTLKPVDVRSGKPKGDATRLNLRGATQQEQRQAVFAALLRLARMNSR